MAPFNILAGFLDCKYPVPTFYGITTAELPVSEATDGSGIPDHLVPLTSLLVLTLIFIVGIIISVCLVTKKCEGSQQRSNTDNGTLGSIVVTIPVNNYGDIHVEQTQILMPPEMSLTNEEHADDSRQRELIGFTDGQDGTKEEVYDSDVSSGIGSLEPK